MTICKHQFHAIGEATKLPQAESLGLIRVIGGVEVVCVNCGQVRKAYADGRVEIVVQGGILIEEDHERTD